MEPSKSTDSAPVPLPNRVGATGRVAPLANAVYLGRPVFDARPTVRFDV